MKIVPGIAACLAIAAVATALGARLPVVGAPVFAIAIGLVLTPVVRGVPALQRGAAFSGKALLQWAIVLFGANLSVVQIIRGGAAALPVTLGTFVIVLLLAYVLGRALGLDATLRRLLGIGTAICGGSAIAAVSSVVEADPSDVAYALGTVFFFNVVALLTFPPLGHLMHMSQSAFGLWAGTAINDTSSVVAAAFAYGSTAGADAIVVKLTRTLLIVPVVLFYAWKRIRARRGSGDRVDWFAILPWFVLWFAFAAICKTEGWIPASWTTPLQMLAMFAIVCALAGVGLSADIARMRSAGLRPLALGAALWIAIAASSLLIARATGLG
ncbi:MAG TPA: putative sulfate exporter family transporter [Candidatus Tumulicola sp.]|jgi:uncharacterized integral membrane protein (TIGR00698 family)